MTKLIIGLSLTILVLLGTLGYTFKKIGVLETEKKTLEVSIEKFNKGQLEASNTINKLRKEVDKKGDDCYYTVIDSDVLDILHDK